MQEVFAQAFEYLRLHLNAIAIQAAMRDTTQSDPS